MITVADAARNFADCVSRAHYERSTFVLLKDGKRFARIEPDGENVCTGRDLAALLAENRLSEDEARAWHGDLVAGRNALKAPHAKWR